MICVGSVPVKPCTSLLMLNVRLVGGVPPIFDTTPLFIEPQPVKPAPRTMGVITAAIALSESWISVCEEAF